MRESSLVLSNNAVVIDYQVGNSYSVKFDFEKIWNFYKKTVKGSSFFDFYHVHPVGCENYSSMDENCMKGFAQAFGYSPYFHIVVFKNDSIFDIEHKLFSYTYDLKENKVVNFPYIKSCDGKSILILKLLAFKDDRFLDLF